ncbi:MAG TPA: IS66 family transposase, partial [Gammaproteobacteria bacterium]|nr:IS66 family transposase [Gammaproteobacteria bacterium]
MANARVIEELQDDIAARDTQVATLERELKESRYDVSMLKLKVDDLLRRLYGRSSEKSASGQLDLLGDMPQQDDAPDDEATHETPPEKRRRAHGGRKPLPADLRRERIVYEVPQQERSCTCCGETMQPFAEDVTEELEYIPAQHFVKEHVRPKYACKDCQQGVMQAALPPRPIEKGIPGPGLLAHVLVSKYVDHLPLYRQSGIFKRSGIDLARSTLCDWVAVCVEELEPIVAELRRTIVASSVVQADETPIVVLENHNEKKRRQGWLWVYRSMRGETAFDYRPTRARDGPREFLADFEGTLQRDGYQGYGGLSPGIVHVGCWAHARRKFNEAKDSSPEQAQAAIRLIGKLYAIEKNAKELSSTERQQLRAANATPVLDALVERLDAWQQDALPKSPLGKAIHYAKAQWETLVRYVEDGAVAIDSNAVERSIRGVAVGRKNWLFAGSAQGAERAA